MKNFLFVFLLLMGITSLKAQPKYVGKFLGNGYGLTNVISLSNAVNPVAYGAVGDGVTVDDNAFSNAWNVVKTVGGTFDFRTRGKTFVLNRFTFLAPNGAVDGKTAMIGTGSSINYIGTNWPVILTNVIPNMKDITIRGTVNAKGGMFITGTPSSRILENLNFSGFTNGYGLFGEALENFKVKNLYATYCKYGATFGQYCDFMDVDLRFQNCVIGVQSARTNEYPSLMTYGGGLAPIGGRWKVVGLFNGDLMVGVFRNIELNIQGENSTNTFISMGHNLARHGAIDAQNGAAFSLDIKGIFGFGNRYQTNAPVELVNVGSIINADIELYGADAVGPGYTNLVKVVDVNAQGGSTINVSGFSQVGGVLVRPITLPDGSAYPSTYGNFPNKTVSSLERRLFAAPSSINTSVTDRPVFDVGTQDYFLTLPAFRAGYFYVNNTFNLYSGGLIVDWVSAGLYQVRVTNAVFQVTGAGGGALLGGTTVITNGWHQTNKYIGSISVAPGNTVTPVGWMPYTNGTTRYYVPFYQ